MKYLLAIALLLTLLSTEAEAATTITSPVGGECLKAGTTLALSWTRDPNSDHSYSSIWLGSSQPTYANGQDSVVGGHFASSPLNWTLPNVTQSGYQLYVESHSGGHSNVSTALSGKFSIDASGPGTPSISAGSVSSSGATINWSEVSDPGCKGLAGYKLYRNSNLIYSGTGTSYTDSGLAAQSTYTYHIVAFDDFVATSGNTISVTTAAAPQSPTTTTTTTNSSSPTASTPVKATGSLECVSSTDTTATLKYTYANASNATLFQSSQQLQSYGASSGSGNYTVTKLSPQTKNDFVLRNGTSTSSTSLATTTCITLAAKESPDLNATSEPTTEEPSAKDSKEAAASTGAAVPVEVKNPKTMSLVIPLSIGIGLATAAGGGWWLFRMRHTG